MFKRFRNLFTYEFAAKSKRNLFINIVAGTIEQVIRDAFFLFLVMTAYVLISYR